MNNVITKVAVIGAGSWGTALADILGKSGLSVMMFARKPDVAHSIAETHHNPRYLSEAKLSDNVSASSNIATCMRDARVVCIVTPSSVLRKTAQKIKPYLSDNVFVVLCSKGIEARTGKLGSQIFREVVGHPERIAVLSGPTHAEEVINRIPTAAVIASRSHACAAQLQNLFSLPMFRLYTTDDLVGVELCGAYKNIIAIACGMAYGIGYGDNTSAMIITRGLAEMSRLVQAQGGVRFTCMGLAGLGDLVVTCGSKHSRNRRLGYEIAKGKTLDDFHQETHMIAEGALACKTIKPLAEKSCVTTPIADMVRAVLWEEADLRDAERALLDRPLKPEF